jgi:hypothetical protein
MIKSLNEANKTLDQAKFFYRGYIRQILDQIGEEEAMKIINKSDKYLYKVIREGSLKQAWKMANQIADTMSANKCTNDNDSCT